ncbi:MAG: thiamine phosphate synthase [Prevotella sp.]|jgi:thiamine-phosphate pyrophosphorylase
MKLAIMTKSTFFVEEDKILASFFNEGLTNLHLFKPRQSPLYSERLLTLLPEEYHKRITVHQNYYLKNEYNLAGIHIDSPEEPVPQGYKGKIGRTCNDLSKLKDMRRKYDYVFLDHVLESRNCTPAYTLQQLKEASDRGIIDRHVWALGGVTMDNIPLLRDLGFGGVVVCSDIWERFNIQSQNEFKSLIDYFVKLKRVVE